MEERINHLKQLYNKIKQAESALNSFERIYDLLQEEKRSIDIKSSSYSYHNNLRQTDEKQARDFKSAILKYKDRKKLYTYYSAFISNFEQDVSYAISMIEHLTGTKNELK